jgi:multiple sugar transport system substrate-binding protein
MLSRRFMLLMAFVLALAIAGCGSSKSSNSGATAKGPTIDASKADSAKGNVTLCIGKDTTGIYKKSTKEFGTKNPGSSAKLVELPEAADQQRAQLVQRLRAKSPECDVLGLDVIWTAEFAAQSWLSDLTSAVDKRRGEFVPATLETAKYENKYWGIPYKSNAGLLYYRTDQVPTAPKTWEDVYKVAGQKNGLVYQGAKYEGLVVNFLELLYSAGGKVLSDDGKTVEVNNAKAKQVLTFMANGIKQGDVPKAVTTYQEEEARRAFEGGKATFMRNWPYAYTLGQQAPIKGKFAVTTFPSYAGAPGAGVLGGYNFAVSAYSKNPEAALKFINFMTAPAQQVALVKTSEPPVITAAYSDPAASKAFPFGASKMLDAVKQAKARPVSPVYPQISEAISTNVHDALTGTSSPDAALKKMSDAIDKALKTF